ncbi:MFS transporter [Paenibacillus segetis]|uniref:MFS transporter n=2 Tax=Paenibacillus segetis TaxID=1325360 RepID=A0ABQ1YDE7_9BACL|nr:MFS transporter [Paenibacillus segetis]
MKTLIWMGCWSYLLIGLAHVVVGSIMPDLLLHYGKDYSAGGSLIFAQFAGFLVGVLVSPLLISKFGKRTGLLIAIGLLCLAELCYTMLPPWEWMYLVGSVAGFGFGMIEAVIGTLIIVAIKEGTAIAMSRLEVFFGIGALVMPLLAGWLIQSDIWRYSFLIVCAMAFIMFIFWLKRNFGDLNQLLDSKEEVKQEKKRLLSQYQGVRGLLLIVFIVFFFLYVGMEMSFVNFLPSLLIEKLGTDKSTAAFSVTLFWIAMTIGRFFAGFIAEKITYSRYVVWSCVISFALISLFAFAKGITMMTVLILLIGLFLSGLFSIALVFANKLLPGSEESTPSMLIASGGVGGAVLPLLMGKSMDIGGADFSAWMLAGFIAVLTLLGIVAMIIQRFHVKAIPNKS